MDNSIDQQFVEFVVKSLVGKPEAVTIDRRIDEKGVLLELTVDPEDLGRVIGKRGATAQSLRTLLRALGTKNDARYNLKIVDNGVAAPGSDDTSVSSAQDDTASSMTDDEVVELGDGMTVEASSAEVSTDDTSRLAQTRRELEDLDDLDV